MAATATATLLAFPGVDLAEAAKRKIKRLKGLALDDYEKIIIIGVKGGVPEFWTRDVTDAEAIAFLACTQQSLIQKLIENC